MLLHIILAMGTPVLTQTMDIHLSGGTIKQIPMAEITKITFDLNSRSGPPGTAGLGTDIISLSPNPAAGELRMQYRVTQKGPVTISILNVTGQTIKKFKPVSRDPGIHTFCWNLRNADRQPVSRGTYLVRVRSGSMILVNKFSLIQ